MLSKLLVLLESSEADKFVVHLYQAPKQYRTICGRPNKGKGDRTRGYLKLLSRAESWLSLGFQGDYRAWEHLLRILE